MNEHEDSYKMIRELVDSYRLTWQEDGRAHISIAVPKRFQALWLVKLNELYATRAEIEEWLNVEPSDQRRDE